MDELDSLSIRDLRAVIALAERLHFGRAAEDLSMAQPSLSATVKKVEEAVGERLFERTSRQVSPDGGRAEDSAAHPLGTGGYHGDRPRRGA